MPLSNKTAVVSVTDAVEYGMIEDFFMQTLAGKRITVCAIECIQNLAMWQSYAVKKQTTIMRDSMKDHRRINNKGALERKWLFHGTSEETIPLIAQQGFNRAFAGKNAVAYGKGVYFARDAVYSSSTLYSRPDAKGVQRMFLCR